MHVDPFQRACSIASPSTAYGAGTSNAGRDDQSSFATSEPQADAGAGRSAGTGVGACPSLPKRTAHGDSLPVERLRSAIRHIAGLLAPLLWAGCAGTNSSPSVPTELNGACIETLTGWKGDFLEDLGVGLALAYRQTPGRKAFVLLQTARPDGACGVEPGHVIVATLLLPPLPAHQWFAVNLDCHDPTGRVKKGDAVVAIFDKENARMIPTPAEQAWRVDPASRVFQAVPGVACDSFS